LLLLLVVSLAGFDRLLDRPPPQTLEELEGAIITPGPPRMVALPLFDQSKLHEGFTLDPLLVKFERDTPLADGMAWIEYQCRRLAAADPRQQPPAPGHPTGTLVDVAKHVLNCLSAINQLPGWAHVEAYIASPIQYLEHLKHTARSSTSNASSSSSSISNNNNSAHLTRSAPALSSLASSGASGIVTDGSIEQLQVRGRRLLQWLCQRVQWLIDLSKKSGREFQPEHFIRVIAVDRNFGDLANSFMKDAELKVTHMLTNNQQKFHQFREIQRRGVLWPHSPALRKEVEAAGFVFRPMVRLRIIQLIGPLISI
jgi:hypothetical protein